MKNLFRKLFDYNFHYNEKLANRIINNPTSTSQKSRVLFNHILVSHHIWYSRIARKQIEYEIWEVKSDNLLNKLNQTNLSETILILDSINLATIINYNNSKGKYFKNTL